MCPKEKAAAVTALAVLIYESLDEPQSLYLAAIFSMLGDTIAALAAGNAACEK